MEAIKEIRQFNGTIPIYLISSYELRKAAQTAGANGYLDKYEDKVLDQMQEAVRRHCYGESEEH